MKIRFGKIDTYFLFGGGILLSECAFYLRQDGCNVLVATSARHEQERISVAKMTLGQHLEDEKLEYIVSENVNVDERIINRITANTLGISLGAAWIFDEHFIQRFKGKLINLHGARLPQGRGGGNFTWQILRENRLGFCVIHRIDAGIDSGPLIKYREFFYPSWCRIPRDYQEAYIEENRGFLKELFAEIKSQGEFICIDQLEYLSTYWPRLSTEEHGFLDWSWNVREIERFICAFDEPYRGASTFVNGKKVFLKAAFVNYQDGSFHPFQKGIVYRKASEALFVAMEEGGLVIKNVTNESGASVISDVRVGDRFYTPRDFLEKAKLYRAFYNDKGLKS